MRCVSGISQSSSLAFVLVFILIYVTGQSPQTVYVHNQYQQPSQYTYIGMYMYKNPNVIDHKCYGNQICVNMGNYFTQIHYILGWHKVFIPYGKLV